MTESRHALDDLPALMDERRKYESWLAALEARRDTTPGHVFDRVKGDYLKRLQGVEDQLVTHRHAIEEERATSQSRLSILSADEQLRRDERAELELRSHVGELGGADAEVAFRNIDSTLRRLLDEEQSVNDRIAELNALLNFKSVEKTPPEPSIAHVASAAAPPAPAPTNDGGKTGRNTPGGTFDELAFLSEVVGEEERRAAKSDQSDWTAGLAEAAAAPAAAVPRSATAPLMPAKPAGGAGMVNAAAAHPVPAALAAAPHSTAANAPASASHASAAAAADAEPAVAFVAAPPAPVVAPPIAAAPAASGGAAGTAGADGASDSREPLIPRRPSFMRKDDASQSLLAGIENAPRRASRDAPLAANVASNTPIVLKATGAVEQSKTLKCTECGAMNYPTEWYCERCGAELAAL